MASSRVGAPVAGRRLWSWAVTSHGILVGTATLLGFGLLAAGQTSAARVVTTPNYVLGIPWSGVLTQFVPVSAADQPDELLWQLALATAGALNLALHWSLYVLVTRRGRPGRSADTWTPRPAERSAGLAFLCAAVLGAATWAAWLGWDTSYYLVPPEFPGDTGERGPYTTPQVLGCAATVGLVTVVLAMRQRPVPVAAGVTLGFWLPFTVYVLSSDPGPLAGFGLMMILVGLAVGVSIAAVFGYALGRAVEPRSRQSVG